MLRNVSFDMHGVIDVLSEQEVLELLQRAPYKLYIISGARKSVVEKEFSKRFPNLNINRFTILSILDYLDGKVEIFWKENKRGILREVIEDDDLWDSIKAILCKENDIDLHIDDTEVYGKYFKGKAKFMTFNKDILYA